MVTEQTIQDLCNRIVQDFQPERDHPVRFLCLRQTYA